MENQLQVALSTSLLDSQKEVFLSQIEQLHNIVLHQCQLTGVNPLSQEMAAGALSIKIGKRPRDLINPKAIKYMQSVFSIKDAINKRETREISSLFGVTVTQVRDFFTAQRTRVRKFLRLSREKASALNTSIESSCAIPLSSDTNLLSEPVPLDCVVPTPAEEGPSCSAQDEVLTGIEETDRDFVDNIFTLMRKEESFSGQVKIMDWIMEIHSPTVQYWFLAKGGVMILATWLSQAAIEEQTSVLHDILKVLCHLPLHKASPVHMSAILQSVNRLRFYRAPDISNRARILLAKWSKMFAKSQAMKKRNGIKSASDAQDELLLQQSIGEVMGKEIWNSKLEDFEESHVNLSGASENSRMLDSQQPVKLLTASADDSNKKLNKGALASKTRERRKVQLMEQPSQRMTGRSLPVGRPAPATQGRPLSADDIQKAKLRAQFMQSKYGKANNDSSRMKTEAPNAITSPQDAVFLGAKKLQDSPKVDGDKVDSVSLKGCTQPESVRKLSSDVEEPPWKRCRRMQIPWRRPPEMKMSDTWKVCAGGESKEVDIQNNRIRRERETIYRTLQEIPLNPKEPWDREMDPDDSLTIEIPIEQLPDADSVETGFLQLEDKEPEAALASMESAAEPDVELLAVLLKNPELVYALTSGNDGNLSSEETVKLLDMIKANGVNTLRSQTDLGRNAEKKVEVSLPSPTPSSDPGTSISKQDFAKNPFSQRIPKANGASQVAALVHSQENFQASSSVYPQSTLLVQNQQLPIAPLMVQQLSMLQAAAESFGKDHRMSQLNSINQTVLANPVYSPFSASEPSVNRNNYPVFGSTEYNLHSATTTTRIQDEMYGNIRSSSMPTANVQQRTINQHLPHMAESHAPPRPPLQTQLQPGYAEMHRWGTMPGSGLNRGYQENSIPNHSNAHLMEPRLQQAAWRGNNTQAGFESWSPDNSPVRLPEHVPRWNYPENRMNYRVDWSQSQNQDYYSGYRGPDKDGNRRR